MKILNLGSLTNSRREGPFPCFFRRALRTSLACLPACLPACLLNLRIKAPLFANRYMLRALERASAGGEPDLDLRERAS